MIILEYLARFNIVWNYVVFFFKLVVDNRVECIMPNHGS